MEHMEFVVEYKDGTRDWVDPVNYITGDEEKLYVNNYSHTHEFVKENIDKWIVRPYTPETTYDEIEESL